MPRTVCRCGHCGTMFPSMAARSRHHCSSRAHPWEHLIPTYPSDGTADLVALCGSDVGLLKWHDGWPLDAATYEGERLEAVAEIHVEICEWDALQIAVSNIGELPSHAIQAMLARVFAGPRLSQNDPVGTDTFEAHPTTRNGRRAA